MIDENKKTTYDESIVIDGLNVSNWESSAVFDSLNNGNVTAINATIAVWEHFTETMDNISKWLHRFRNKSDFVTQVTKVQDILDAKKNKKTGVIFGWQNASPIENDLDRLELFHNLGVKIIQITYNERNLLGNGCWERNDEGLSNFGKDAVKEMNRLGILIDLSHVGDQTTIDSISLKNLSYQYADIVAVNSVNLDIQSNQIVGLVGSVGSGKTTILNILCGILEPSSGQLLFNQTDSFKFNWKSESLSLVRQLLC